MQGTAPFIAIELLIHATTHRVAHNLESLLYVLLFICTHLDGPACQVRNPPLYGGDKRSKSAHPSIMKEWLESNKFSTLGHNKFSHMVAHFDDVVEGISPYFSPLKVYIQNFWGALIPERALYASNGKRVVRSPATPQDIIEVFKTALQDKDLIAAHKSTESSVLGKRSVPGDLVAGLTGWDPVKIAKTANPKLSPHHPRKAKFMTKR
jgi:hypothetical protein